MFVLLFLCGWFQGMGWPPCGRTMVHWWSQKERGGIVSVWNCAHNVGGGIPPLLFLLGMAWFNDWHAALYMPAFARYPAGDFRLCDDARYSAILRPAANRRI
ncbi:glycerol-3-phosphate transporter [Klebsiella quasipneumoniae]|nr:glycerol-3-phosphate transporter [Klebsiella quasipneumoniae]